MDKTKLISATIDCVDKKGVLPEISDLVQSAGASKEVALKFKDSDEYDNIRAIRKRFTQKRKDGFKTFAKFYAWHSTQAQKCYYCGTSQDELNKLFENELISSKKFSESLHIERKDSNKGYGENNCVLACALCNNAKSDMISDENFKAYFGKQMRDFISDLLSGKITNNIRGRE